MNISEEKRTQICAALAKAQQDIKRIQAAGAMDNSPEEMCIRDRIYKVDKISKIFQKKLSQTQCEQR